MLQDALDADRGLARDDMTLAVMTVGDEEVQMGEAVIRTIDIRLPF